MAFIEEALRARLTGFAGLAALVSARIHPDKLPPEPSPLVTTRWPALTYQVVSTERVYSLEGFSCLARPTFQIDVWATSQSSRVNVAHQVKLALEGFVGTVSSVNIRGIFLNSEVDIYEADAEIFRRSLDFEVWHNIT